MLRIIIWVQKELLYHKHEDIKKDKDDYELDLKTINRRKQIIKKHSIKKSCRTRFVVFVTLST